MRNILLLLALLAPLAAQVAPVQQVLQQQQAAWNRRDLEAFMSGYWNSPELTFFGAEKTSGWQATLERYRKRYQTGGREMGKLEFSELQIVALGPDSAFVRGSWMLTYVRWQNPARIVYVGISTIS